MKSKAQPRPNWPERTYSFTSVQLAKRDATVLKTGTFCQTCLTAVQCPSCGLSGPELLAKRGIK